MQKQECSKFLQFMLSQNMFKFLFFAAVFLLLFMFIGFPLSRAGAKVLLRTLLLKSIIGLGLTLFILVFKEPDAVYSIDLGILGFGLKLTAVLYFFHMYVLCSTFVLVQEAEENAARGSPARNETAVVLWVNKASSAALFQFLF